MPRLFVSHRQQPRQSGVSREVSAAAQAIAPVSAMVAPTPSPPSMVVAQAVPGATTDEGLPLVLVPPVPDRLARLMDSHDLDNPYLLAAFNVLMENGNNPMRVPDILQAVIRKGWTQVLHRHKDRPEQLFGNALRSHQRRREMMGKPSLVFMIDAGSCWKHHQIDLSAASGRKKGKIWCFSQDAGFACPYARLGLDLGRIMRAQAGDPVLDDDDEDTGKHTNHQEDAEECRSTSQPSRKKRKMAPSATKMDPTLAARFEEAVRGSVGSVHSAATQRKLEPPPYIPAAIINPNPQEVPYGVRVPGLAQRVQPKQALPIEIIARPTAQTRGRTRRGEVRAEPQQEIIDVDLDELTAMSPEPEVMEMEEDVIEQAPPTVTVEEIIDLTATVVSTEPLYQVPNALLGRDDDEDDFHLSVHDFAVDAPEIKLELEDHAFLSAPSPIEDAESSDSGASVVRTPTPPVEDTHAAIARWTLATEPFEMHGHDAPFHLGDSSFGSFDNWEVDPFAVKREDENQGWSRANSPMPQFSEFAKRREEAAAREVERIMSNGRELSEVMEPMELDTIPFPPSYIHDDMSVGSISRPLSRAGSLLSVGRESVRSGYSGVSSPSVASMLRRTRTLRDSADVESRRMSLASSSRPHSPHPVILYSPALTPSSVDSDRPFKNGLAHKYLAIDVQTDEPEPLELLAAEEEVKGLEHDLLDLSEAADNGVEVTDYHLESSTLSMAFQVVPPTPSQPIGIKRPRSPSF